MHTNSNIASTQTSISFNNGPVFPSPASDTQADDDLQTREDIGSVLDGFHLHELVDDDDYADYGPTTLVDTVEGVLNGTYHQLLPELRIVSLEDPKMAVRVDEDSFLMDWFYPGRNNVRSVLPDIDFTDVKTGTNEYPRPVQGEDPDSIGHTVDETWVRNFLSQTVRRNQLLSKGIFVTKQSIAAEVVVDA